MFVLVPTNLHLSEVWPQSVLNTKDATNLLSYLHEPSRLLQMDSISCSEKWLMEVRMRQVHFQTSNGLDS
jgi:hypothetical protein